MPNSKENQHSATLDEVFSAVNSLSVKTDERFLASDKKISDLGDLVHDVLVTVNDFADQTQKQFEKIDERFEKIDERFEKIESTMATKEDLAKMETRLVTKYYLDDKLSDLRGGLVVTMRKGDTKLKTLVGVLAGKKVISQNDVKKIYSLEPFAQ